ncbi:aldo/keto reductase [Schlesneria paludicola]|uniref:aldo/keto reductase n=1 Tax=Schlesneria paludicola TaxID=360056 RepID=UPI00029AB267|nr:aldo/keto reductase [Schlesneria paludicola]
MLIKRLGRTGLDVSQLGYGSMGLRGPKTWGVRVVDDESAERILNRVLDSGINLIDTAPDYGITEQRIGQFISARRSEFYLATKCGCAPIQHADSLETRHLWERDVVARNLEASLERMRTNCIDIWQFHGGDAETLQRAGLIDLMLDARRQGLIRFLGVSSSLPNLTGFVDLGVFDTFQIPYSCLAPEHHDLISRAAEAGAGIIIRGGIAQGGPDAAIQRPALNDVWARANLSELLPEGMSRTELILRFTLTHPHSHTTIVGTCNLDHLAENLDAAAKGPLPQSLYDEVRLRVASVLEDRRTNATL